VEAPVTDDRDDDLLNLEHLCEDLDPTDARDVLGPHSALTRSEVEDRHEMLLREREARP
jgi:hypothetical protein